MSPHPEAAVAFVQRPEGHPARAAAAVACTSRVPPAIGHGADPAAAGEPLPAPPGWRFQGAGGGARGRDGSAVRAHYSAAALHVSPPERAAARGARSRGGEGTVLSSARPIGSAARSRDPQGAGEAGTRGTGAHVCGPARPQVCRCARAHASPHLRPGKGRAPPRAGTRTHLPGGSELR